MKSCTRCNRQDVLFAKGGNWCKGCVREYHHSPIGRASRAKANARYNAKQEVRLAHNLRSRLRTALLHNYKSGSAIGDLGCSIAELEAHLERQFKPGMTWANYGEWHIDHIKPLAKFDLTDRVQLLAACHYSNLQPLWAIENLSKGDSLVDIQRCHSI